MATPTCWVFTKVSTDERGREAVLFELFEIPIAEPHRGVKHLKCVSKKWEVAGGREGPGVVGDHQQGAERRDRVRERAKGRRRRRRRRRRKRRRCKMHSKHCMSGSCQGDKKRQAGTRTCFVCMYMYIHTYIHTYVCMYVCMYMTCMYAYMHTYACMYVHMHVCMHACMHTYIHTYIHIHAYKRALAHAAPD